MLKLTQVTINKYKSFLTGQTISIENGTTRIVGRNESGKTAFLEALSKYNFFNNSDTKFVFNKTQDYPRNELKAYESQDPDNSLDVVSCVFSISDELLQEIQNDVGSDAFTRRTVTVRHKYNGGKTFDLQSDDLSGYIVKKYIEPNIPQFWYFDEYYTLPGEINLTKFQKGIINADLTKEQFDILTSLFSLANVDVTKFLIDNDFEDLISELEATSNTITDKFLEYWSTDNNLEVKFEPRIVNNEKLLSIRIRNTKHRVTLPLKNRSKGFIWFFSFFVWFSQIENKDNIIILLDEPGLNLHADAQKDLLRFIDEKLAPKYQVIYTTHSPFMIDPSKLHDVRSVYDSEDAKIGSVISDALEEKDKATLFPMQAAIGYSIAQNMFISPKNLLVKGVADLVFLNLISEKLRDLGKTSLNEDVTIIPVGGLDKAAVFISLLKGNELTTACLLDSYADQKGQKRLSDLIRDKIINENGVIFFDEFTNDIKPSEIEDMFTVEEYLMLFNNAFSEYEYIAGGDVGGNSSIVTQIHKIIGKDTFNHYRPANYLSRNLILLDNLSEATLDRFARAFERINYSLK